MISVTALPNIRIYFEGFIVSQRRNFYVVPLRELLEVYREGDLAEEFTRPRVRFFFFAKINVSVAPLHLM